MASSRPPRRDSSVKRRPRRYASKVRRCRSQRIALRAPLTRLAMPHPHPVHRAHPVHGPPDGDLREQRVQVLLLALYPPGQPQGVLLEVAPIRAPPLERRPDGTLVDVALVENEKRLLAGPPPAQSSDPREVLVRARVHPHPVADAHEERHLHYNPSLQSGGRGCPPGPVPPCCPGAVIAPPAP